MSFPDFPIEETTFVVVDTETTGVRADVDRIIEVAAVKVRGGEVVDRFQQLVNPGRSVPRRITDLTSITTGMVFQAPAAAEVLPRFLAFLGEGVLVAHNLPFDQRFLEAELQRLGAPPLRNETLCTLRLARRLLPGLRSKGLASVADHYGVSISGRHRALGDAEATATILLRFLARLDADYDVTDRRDLLAFQNKTYRRVSRPARHLERIRKEVLNQIPERPGVYFMKDGQGQIIYVGKALRLRDRVRSYFTAVEAHPPRTRQLVEAVRDVTWEETGSELAALLRESRLIKELQPRFNRAQRRYRSRPFIRLDTSDRFPKVSWISYVLNDGAEYFGPLAGRRQAELVLELIGRFFRLRSCDDDVLALGRPCLYAELGRCDAPCTGGEAATAYADEVQRVRDFLTGRDHAVRDRLEEAMREAAARMEFEHAGQYRDWLHRLERMAEKQELVAAPVLSHHAVVVHPGAVGGRTQLFMVRFGRHVDTVTLGPDLATDELRHLRERLATHFDDGAEEPDRYFKQEVDEIRILAHWMYVHRDHTQQVPWRPGHDVSAFMDDVLAAVARVGDR